jgi:hypothetical protein
MELLALVEPSKGLNPGHMVIGQGFDDGTSRYFGFRFDPTDLPEEYRDPKEPRINNLSKFTSADGWCNSIRRGRTPV